VRAAREAVAARRVVRAGARLYPVALARAETLSAQRIRGFL